uniref:Uncharacterized protein n=1 Tax=Caenorhabditis tropicalis TaxID=1561998 RepID=A0A1I7V3U1_9PELO
MKMPMDESRPQRSSSMERFGGHERIENNSCVIPPILFNSTMTSSLISGCRARRITTLSWKDLNSQGTTTICRRIPRIVIQRFWIRLERDEPKYGLRRREKRRAGIASEFNSNNF